jgi:hypothetical protein
MASSLQTVAELPQFIRDADTIRLSEEERTAIVKAIAANPQTGDVIRGSGGLRKVRFAARAKGKSGGHRVITTYFGPEIPVYLVAILSKRDRGSFSVGEIAGFRKMTSQIAEYWRRRTG